MLRIDFTADALLHTRFAPDPAPLMELGLGLATVQRRDTVFDRWRRDVRPRLGRATAPLFELIPATGAGPTFLDPVTSGVEEGVDQVLSSPQDLVADELRRVTSAGKAITPWLRELDARDGDAWTTLGHAVRTAHGVVIAPWWSRITAAYRAELAVRSRLFTLGGMRAVLQSLYPASTWRDGTTLEIPVESQLHLTTGRAGVLLLPSVLWGGRPLVAPMADGTLLVVYAASTPVALVDGDGADGDSLAQLLGATRAAVLTTALGPHTTTELARHLGISLASASAHAKILRDAGLITTTRDGKAVLHAATALGAHLVASADD